MQQEGEALYLPAGWAHATRNLSPSIGVGGQAIWSAEDRQRSAANTGTEGGKGLLSWLGIGGGATAGEGGGGRDYFSHVNAGLAAALQGDHATAASECVQVLTHSHNHALTYSRMRTSCTLAVLLDCVTGCLLGWFG